MRVEIRPSFDEAVMSAELPVRKAAAKLLRLVYSDPISFDLPQILKTVIPEAILIGNPGSDI
jgi:hypothetical protein